MTAERIVTGLPQGIKSQSAWHGEAVLSARSGRPQLPSHLRSGSMRDGKQQKAACAISLMIWALRNMANRLMCRYSNTSKIFLAIANDAKQSVV